MRLHDMAVGQVGEWLIWSHLVATSDGDLHVFLPLEDRGIDGIIHRISTDRYARVQVKVRSWDRHHRIDVGVGAAELADDQAVLVAAHIDFASSTLGGTVLVIPAPDYRRLAHRYEMADGAVVYSTELLLPPPPDSIWRSWCCALSEMGERLLPATAIDAAPAVWLAPGHDAAKRLGARAEMELLRRATDCDALNVFKAHPDLEPNEYVLYNTASRTVRGIQVKAVTLPAGDSEANVSVYRPPLRPSATTWFVVLLADARSSDFLPECAVIPADVVSGILHMGSRGHGNDGHFVITRGVTGRLAEWRVPLASLGARLGSLPLWPLS